MKLTPKVIAKYKAILTFIMPALSFYLLFLIYPIIKSFYLSFHFLQMSLKATRLNYVGWQNFMKIVFEDEVFWLAAKHSLTWAALSCSLEIPLGLVLAILLHKRIKGARFFRNTWFLPVLLSYVVVALIWSWLYNPHWGLLNALLKSSGLGNLARPWLGDPQTALYALILVTTWQWTGFNMVILLAAIHSVPDDLFDAAKIDGVSEWQNIRYIVIPLLRRVIVTCLILCFIGKMKVFDLVWIATQGGPMWATETVATYIVRRAFYWGTFDMGYASAIATLWFVIIFTIALILTKILQSKEVLEY